MDELVERERELAAIEALLERRGGFVLVEGRAGIGKTSLVDAACRRAEALGHEVLRARGSELEAGFAFGVVRQLFERRLAGAAPVERDALLAGPAGVVEPLLLGRGAPAHDASFTVLHGLYWLAVNLAEQRPLLIAVDDAHWADDPSLRWLAYLAARVEGAELAMLLALWPTEPTLTGAPLLALRAQAPAVLRPALLSEDAVGAIVRAATNGLASDEQCAALCAASGGNPLYAGWMQAFPDAHVDVEAVHIVDDVAVEEGTFTGTHDGVLRLPDAAIEPTGRPVSLGYIQVLRFREGAHVSFNLMFDRLAMLEQLGLATR